LQTQGFNISSEGKLSLLTGWFKLHKEGHRCYFVTENSYRVEGYEIIRPFRKSKEQLIKEFEELKFKRNVISVIIEELLKTDELKAFLGYNCTHRPEDCDKSKFNLFGHVHGLCKIKKYGLNVGTDCHNFKPVGLTDVEFFRDAIENVYDINVFE